MFSRWQRLGDLWLAIAIAVLVPAAIFGGVRTLDAISTLLLDERSATWDAVEAHEAFHLTRLAAVHFQLSPDAAALDDLKRQFDIFRSRVPTLANADAGAGAGHRTVPRIAANSKLSADTLPRLEQELALAEIGAAASVKPFAQTLETLEDPLHEMVRLLRSQDDMRDRARELSRGAWVAGGFLLLAILAGAALIAGNIRKTRRLRQLYERERAAQLERASQPSASVPGGVAHDFNNILAAISGFAALLEFDLDDKPRQRHMLHQIGTAADRGKELVQSICGDAAITAGAAVTEPAAADAPALPAGALRILLVDDDPLAREALELTLQKLDCETAVCESGAEALALLHDEPDLFDLIVTDYLMPNMTGLEMAAALRARGFGKPIILASSRPQDIPACERDRLEVDGLISKPFTERALGETIGRVARLPVRGPKPAEGRIGRSGS
ncbi:response regulator [Dongia sp.]|uniref:response regulator n=1 Tax=Dongia sp. TaxID=1977262 RepID=UPI0035AEEDA6